MTPRERVLRVLHGQRVDRVPFTVYECMIPQCAAEREMRNRGLCIVNRSSGVLAAHRPNVKVTTTTYNEGAIRLVRTVYETPAGALRCVMQPAGFTSWYKEYPFKSPDDYRALLFLIRDERYEADYAPFAAAQEAIGEDAILRAGIALEPLQQLISGGWLSPEDFCVEWMDRRDEILKLYDALAAKHREVYPIVAASPASHANYGGNVVPEIIGVENFRRYYLPHYNEAAEIFHRHGKFLGCHFDANCRALAEDIAGSGLDYIEAFTPAPGSDMTLAQARAAWPGKVLWLNFPSALHLSGDATVTKATEEMLSEMESPDGVIMGVTEDMPPDRWQDSCRAIMDGLENHSRRHPNLYGN